MSFSLQQWFVDLMSLYEYGIIAYLFTLSTIYFVLILIGFFAMIRHRFAFSDSDENRVLEASPLVAPVSILAPAYNESASICDSVRAMLKLTYPQFEVIVINDGSTDNTLRLLIEEFHLYRSARYYEHTLPGKAVRGVYESMDPIPLVVVDKENGGKADALNIGINVARYPLVCAVDCDSLLESDALMRVSRPFLEDPNRVLAVGGIVRVANGCQIGGGRVLNVDLPRSWIGKCQVVEYLRSFLGGRVAFSAFNSLIIISGAFGMFSKRAVLAVGGYRTDTVGEDMELIVRLHKWARQQKLDYRIVFQPDPVCWTEVPESLRILKRQRNRWQRGSLETFWIHKDMVLRPKFGGLGMFAFPYFILFETFGPLVELAGYGLTVIGLFLGVFDVEVVFLFFITAVLYGMILSTASVILEELSTKRYPRVRNLLTLIAASFIENLGFRQLLTFWRATAFLDLLRGNKSWGAMERQGLRNGAAADHESSSPAADETPHHTGESPR